MRISLPLSSVMTAVCFTTILSGVAVEAGWPRELWSGDDSYGLHAVTRPDAVHHVHPAGDAAEDRIFAVEKVGVAESDVELAARGVGMLAARHGHRTAIVLLLVEL